LSPTLHYLQRTLPAGATWLNHPANGLQMPGDTARCWRSFIPSVPPSVDKKLLTFPSRLHICCQKVAANCGPQSETMLCGSPWRRTTSRRNNSTSPRASIVVWQGMQCRIFESRSTTTQIASNPSHSGNPTTIYQNIFPWFIPYRQRPKDPKCLMSSTSGPLAIMTIRNILIDILTHFLPIISPIKQVKCFCPPRLSC